MSDLIDRQAMIDAMRRRKAVFSKNKVEYSALPKDEKARVDEIDNCISDLVNAPDAEPERKTGFWKDYGSGEWHCSECGLDVLTEGSWEYPESRDYNFCPHCGADMRGE